VLLVQANRGLRTIVGPVKEPEKLPVVLPVPAGVINVGETFVFDFTADVVERGKQAGRRRSLGSQPLLFRQAQCANTGENLQPRQE
jgi:hypothetical protein